MRRMTEDLTGDESDGRLRNVLALALVSILIGGVLDLAMDRPRNWLSFHVIFESSMVAGALLMATTLWMGWWHAAHDLREAEIRLLGKQAEREAWKENARRALEGLAAAMDRQFDVWGLTNAEREVAVLLLKGYSHKRVAQVTGRGERTARQHAASVYHKANLRSRAELAGFFLEDLLLPASERNGSMTKATS